MKTEVSEILFLLLIIFVLDTNCVISKVLLCDPAEEGSNHVVEFKINTACDVTPYLGIITWNGYLSGCANNWTTSQPDKYKISMKTEDFGTVISVLIYNISFKTPVENEVWFKLEDAICTIQEYVRATNISCRYNEVGDGFYVSCWSTKIYPMPNCFFESNNHTDISVFTSTHSDDGFNQSHETVNCTIFLPNSSVQCNFNVTVYPNITGSMSDIHRYGTKKLNIFNIDVVQPSIILRNCPTEVKDGSVVTCECASSNSNASNISIRWYLLNKTVSDNGSLSFTANKTLQAIFHCRSTKEFGCQSGDVYYKPIFLNPGYDFIWIMMPLSVTITLVVGIILGLIIGISFVQCRGTVCLKNRETTTSSNTIELHQHSADDVNSNITPVDENDEAISPHTRTDYDSIEPYHEYETFNGTPR